MLRCVRLLLVFLPAATSLPRVYATAHSAGQGPVTYNDQTNGDIKPLTAGVVESVSGLIDQTNGVFSAPRNGVYVVRGSVQFACMASNCVLDEVWLYLARQAVGGSFVNTGNGGIMSGTSAAYAYDNVGSNDNVQNVEFTWMIELNSGDKVKMVGNAKSSSSSGWSWSVAGGTYMHVISVD